MPEITGAPALELKGLTHRYGKNVALDDISLTLPAGRVYGLLGRNGAGKTTMLNVLSATLFPQKGQALVFGKPVFERPEALKRLCVVREKTAYPKNLKVRDALFACEGSIPTGTGTTPGSCGSALSSRRRSASASSPAAWRAPWAW